MHRTTKWPMTREDRQERERLTRLELVKRGGMAAFLAAGAPTLLAACGGDDNASSSTTGEAPAASGNIDFLSWQGYDLSDKAVPSMKAWKDANNVTMKASYIANNDEFVAKFKAGGTKGVELTTYGQGFADYWTQLGILKPLDADKIPNLANLFPYFASDQGNYWVNSDGERFGVPLSWGLVALIYDSAVIPSPPTSFDILFEPKYKGKVLVQDDPLSVFTSAAHYHGFKMDQLTADQFETCKSYLKELLGQTKKNSPTVGDAASLLASGEAALMYSGWFAIAGFAAAAGGKSIKPALPDKGGYTYVDSYAILPDADNVDTALAFVNQSLVPQTAAEAAISLTGGTAVADAVPLLTDELRALYSYDKLDELFEKAPLFGVPPQQSDEYVTYQQMLDAWDELKAGA